MSDAASELQEHTSEAIELDLGDIVLVQVLNDNHQLTRQSSSSEHHEQEVVPEAGEGGLLVQQQQGRQGGVLDAEFFFERAGLVYGRACFTSVFDCCGSDLFEARVASSIVSAFEFDLVVRGQARLNQCLIH